MNDILDKIRQELKANTDDKTRKNGKRFFKEEIRCYGIKTALVKKIGKEYFHDLKDKTQTEIYQLCEELWQSGFMEESFIASDWSYFVRKDYEPGDLKIFEKWIDLYVGNWASCDTLCNHTVGAFLEMYPEYISELEKWACSKNRWMRRAAAVSLIIPAKHGKFLKEILGIADILIKDSDDLVQKGYGWMLKAASQSHQKQIFDYVIKKKTIMPRTALRYAIEKMPLELRTQAMEK